MIRPAWRVPACLVVLWAAVYLPPLLGGRTLPARDLAATQIPWRTVWRGEVAHGEFPLWDPLSNQGRPLLANPNTMAAYPGTLLFLLAGPERVTAWHIALHHLLLLLGCYVLARRTGAAPGGAGVAAAAVATGGMAWSAATFLNAQASLALAPWALATAVSLPIGGTHRLVRRGLAGGAILGLSFLAGEPITAALAALAWAVVALSTRPRVVWPAAAACAGAALLVAAPVLVPLLTLFHETLRGSLGVTAGAFAADALAPRRWPELFFPNLLGAPLGDASTGFWAAASFPWQRYYPVVFLGSLPVLALPFAWTRERRLAPWWALSTLGLLAAVAAGIPPLAGVLHHVPLLSAVRFGVKFLTLAALASVPLVATGYERLTQPWAGGRRRATTAVLLAIAALAGLSLAAGRPLRAALAAAYPASRSALDAVPHDQLRRAFAGDLLALAVPAAALLVAPAAPLVTVVAVFAADTFAARDVLLWDGDARWRQPPPAVQTLPAPTTVASFAPAGAPRSRLADPALERFWAMRAALVPGYATRWGCGYALARGPDGLEPVRAEFVAAAADDLPDVAARARVAAALGAGAVVALRPLPGWDVREADGVFVNLTPAMPPFAYLARRLVAVRGPVATVHQLADPAFRPGSDAVVEGDGGVTELSGGTVTTVSGPPHRRRFTVDVIGPGLLVVRQSHLSCWRARVDGAPAPIRPANGAQIGVSVPGGRHVVELYLDPTPYRIGLLGPTALVVLWVSLLVASSAGRAGPSGGRGRNTPATRPAP